MNEGLRKNVKIYKSNHNFQDERKEENFNCPHPWDTIWIQAAEAFLVLGGYHTLNIKYPQEVTCWFPAGRVICGGDELMK